MLELKIKLYQRLIYYWDVFFTLVDLYQLQFWVALRSRLQVLEAKTAKKSPIMTNHSQITTNRSQSQPILANYSQNVVFEKHNPTGYVDNSNRCDTINKEDTITIKYKIRRKCGK